MTQPTTQPTTQPEPTTLYDGKYVRLVKQGKWEFVKRKNVTGIVVIAAVTDDRKVILVEQYRAPVAARVIELPAGLAGDIAGQEAEELAAAARRELHEETGYEADRMDRVAVGPVSAGIVDEIMTLFRATGLRKTGTGEGDGSEDITVHEVPLADVESWLADRCRRDGCLVDIKLYAGLYFANQ